MTLKGFAKFAAAALLTATLAVPAHAELKVSGDIDVDNQITNNDDGDGTKTNEYGTKVAGTVRLEDRKESGDNYVEAAITLEFDDQSGETFDMEDTYMAIGNKDMELKVGHFEKLDTYAIGQDEFVAENPKGKGIGIEQGTLTDDAVFGRNDDGSDLTFRYKGVENVTIELGAQFGATTVADSSTDSEKSEKVNVLAYRPVVSVKVADMITVNASYASYKADAQDSDNKSEITKSFMGLNVDYSKDNITAGFNYAAGKSGAKQLDGTKGAGKYSDMYKDDLEQTTMSVYATLAEIGPGSLGFNYTMWKNEAKEQGATEKEKVDGTMWFASYIMPIMGVEGTTMSLGYSQATVKSDLDDSEKGKQSVMGIALDYRF